MGDDAVQRYNLTAAGVVVYNYTLITDQRSFNSHVI